MVTVNTAELVKQLKQEFVLSIPGRLQEDAIGELLTLGILSRYSQRSQSTRVWIKDSPVGRLLHACAFPSPQNDQLIRDVTVDAELKISLLRKLLSTSISK